MQHFLKNLVVVIALLALGAMATWIALRPRIPRGDGFTDGEQLLAATSARDELRLARWEPPELLESLGADGFGAREPFLDPASGRLFFVRGDAGSEELFVATPEGAGFVVRPIAELNTPRRETAPCFHDGWLWFASDRAGGLGGLDLWRAPLAGDRFLAPENAGAPLNTSADETDPALRSSNELWFASNRELVATGDFDLFAAKFDGVRFAPAEPCDGVNTPFDERSPAFAANGRMVVFASDRTDGAGGFDLWRALQVNGRFAQPKGLGAPNGPGDETGATLGDDGFTLLYAASAAPGDAPQLLRARTRELLAVEAPRFTLTDFTILLLLALVALLAWLARRWEALDVLWKCMVVSLLLHLLFLWWTRRVDVEAQAPLLRGPGQTFEVHVLGDLLASLSKLEDRAHGDQVDVAAALPSVSALERSSALPELADASPSETATPIARPDAPRDLAEPAATERTAERSRDSAAPVAAADPLQPLAEPYARQSGAAAAPQLEASEAGALEPATAAAPAAVAWNSAALTGRSDATPAEPSEQGAPRGPARAPSQAADAPSRDGSDLPTADRGSAPAAAKPVATATPTDRAATTPADPSSGSAGALAIAPAAATRRSSAADSAGPPLQRSNAPLADSTPIGDLAPRTESPLAGGAIPAAAAPELPGSSIRGGAERRGPLGATPTVAMQVPAESADGANAADNGAAAGAAAAAPTLALGPTARRTKSSSLASSAPTRANLAAAAAPVAEIAPRAATPLPLPAATLERGADAGAPIASTGPRLYERRFGEARKVALQEGGGSEATERAVLAGLRYLAKAQHPKGWYGDAREVDLSSKYRDVRIGKTALAVLAFLGAGHTHLSATEFSPNVARAIAWITAQQDVASGHFGKSEGYSHGIASYALAECYAMSKDESLVAPLGRALDHLVAMQVTDSRDPRKQGGWTYYYAEGPGFDEFPRASISAWQVMALESAMVGGFEVPPETLAAAKQYFLGSFDPSFDGFRYTHNPSWLNNGYGTLPASTPASMFALTLLGERDHPDVAAAERFVLERQPESWRWRGQDAFVRRGQANIYFMYYSTLALFCRGGESWRQWNQSLQKTLLPAQQKDGSWEEIDLYARDYALDDPSDRAYTTAMCVLMLEVYYRYFTPLLGKVGE